MQSKTIFVHDKIISIIAALFCVLYFLTVIAFIIIGFYDINWLIAGIVFFSLWLMLFTFIILGKSILNLITITDSDIKVKTIFGKVLKRRLWLDFKKIEIVELRGIQPTGRYICLLFKDMEITTRLFNELNVEQDIIVLLYTKKNFELLSTFIERKEK